MTERGRGGDELLEDVVDADGYDGRSPIGEQDFEEIEGNPGLGVERVWIVLSKCKTTFLLPRRIRITRWPWAEIPGARPKSTESRKTLSVRLMLYPPIL